MRKAGKSKRCALCRISLKHALVVLRTSDEKLICLICGMKIESAMKQRKTSMRE
jgi:hypothetical protein